ncbi:MAG TPA: PSD1 and planctomycete cytochrome C domain-containing protein, partial [Patescibacteria group bacterium]|nr:PSD1 and planctomycete cytochrome C domain-containing protein [Patescibacteria group bacterium]
WLSAWLAAFTVSAAPSPAPDATHAHLLFNRDIRPILSDTCFPCHGFDAGKRKADLRLDTVEGATADHKGHQAIKAGDLEGSELWRRVSSTDPKTVMPPPSSGKKLKPDQIALVRQWIVEGAAYQKHWAFEPPVRTDPPAVKKADWPSNDIDRFILATLESKGLQPSPEANKETLIRRLTLDLTGLPPTPDEVDGFLADHEPGAYDRLVERLLASPRYGEQMARYWLDVARYGDTHGLHLDNERSMWPYRDWVVSAFNNNLPYDQFTVWQLAGDLLPNPSREQMIASGFNRCNVSTSEGGAIDEEFQVRYAVDRVETTSAAWLGLTMGCAVCHDHKLDPITQKEFYEVFSLFNNISEKAMDGNALLPPPTMQLPNPDQAKQMADYDSRLSELHKQIRDFLSSHEYKDPATLTNAAKPEPKELVWVEDDFPTNAHVEVSPENESIKWISRNEGPVFSGERAIRRSGKGIDQIYFKEGAEPLKVGAGDRFFAYVYLDPKNPPKTVMLQFHTDNWEHRANWGDIDAIAFGNKGTPEKVDMGALPETGKWVRLEVEAAAVGLKRGTKVTGISFAQFDGTVYWDKAGLLTPNDPAQNPYISFLTWQRIERGLGDKAEASAEIKDLLKKEESKLEDGDRKKLHDYFLEQVYEDSESRLNSLRAEIKPVQKERDELDGKITATMVSKELEKPRPAWVLTRGQYDKHGEAVGPGVPAILPPLPKSEVTNRLTFAKWLIEPRHPLTARVTVNRLWQQFFGVGIVKTTEDFGTKGEWPSHPELLDWLATEFIKTGWDVKHFVRLIVSSATYRQDSKVTPKLLEMDPENRLLTRGPRFRLDAEELRDEALYISGLLNLKMGGRGVRPYQPAGIWEAVGYTTSTTAKYTQDHGEALYRRSLYLFWKRTAPPPTMITFDAPSREKCRARRERTNTPLQALITLNDPQYFEAARHLGYRMLEEGGSEDAARLKYGFRLATGRPPCDSECTVLEESLAAQRAHYTKDVEAAKKTISVGESPVPENVSPPELAAYTMVANLILNLDEVLTRN